MRSCPLEDADDPRRPVDLDQIAGLDRRGCAHCADDGRDAEIARNDHGVAELAAHLGHDSDRADEQRAQAEAALDQRRDRYLAIGESDRMTLRFVKPR